MTVPKHKRSLSDMEFFHNALELRKQLMVLMLKNFNVKDKIRKIDIFKNITGVTDEDKKIVEEILEKYGIRSMILNYPDWFLIDIRTNLLTYLRDLMRNIIYANSIYPVSIAECYERRKYQNRAISCCHTLLQELQFVISLIPCNIEKMMPFVEIIEKEVILLKGWRKSDNRILKAVKNKELKEKEKMVIGESAENNIEESVKEGLRL